MSGFFNRVQECFLPLLRALDIFICSLWLTALYPFNLGKIPTGRERVSGYVGYAQSQEKPWGILAAFFIDWFFEHVLDDGPDHCLQAYQDYLNYSDP